MSVSLGEGAARLSYAASVRPSAAVTASRWRPASRVAGRRWCLKTHHFTGTFTPTFFTAAMMKLGLISAISGNRLMVSVELMLTWHR